MDWSLLWLALHDQEDLNDELALTKVESHRTVTGSAAVPHFGAAVPHSPVQPGALVCLTCHMHHIYSCDTVFKHPTTGMDVGGGPKSHLNI